MVLRRVLSVLTLVWFVSILIVAGWVVVGGPLLMHADAPAMVPNETLDDHGYSSNSINHIRVDETVEYEGVSKQVNISVYAATTTNMTEEKASSLTTVSLPAWRVGGLATTNPLAYAPMAQILEYGLPHLMDDIESVEKVGSQPATVGGTNTTASTFEVTTKQGETTHMYVSRATIDDSLVVVLGMQIGNTDDDTRLLELMNHINAPPSKQS